MVNDTLAHELLDVDIHNFEDYVGFLIDSKFDGTADISYQDISDLVYDKLGIKYGKDWYRIHAQEFLKSEDACEDVEEDNSDIYTAIQDLKKERVKLSDERIQNNAYIRRLAREDTLKEIARDAVAAMNDKFILPCLAKKTSSSTVEGILCLSDWHYGFDFVNAFNAYNPEVAVERVAKLRDKVIDYIQKEHISKLHVLNLGDLIAGRIHLTIRLESRFDVITQIIQVSEILAELLHSFTPYCEVDYYSAIDNHSRLEPKKSDSLDLESLARITDWYIKDRLYGQITVHENKFGKDIITLECLGHKIMGVHGDKDNHVTMIDKLSMMTRDSYDLVLAAHLHHYSSDEKNMCVSIGNGTLMGVDSYAESLRLTSTPSQNLIVVTPENVTESIHRIILN